MKHRYVYGEDVTGDYPNVSVHIERITPEVAKKMLDANTHNRDLKPEKQPLEKAIRDGEWELNGSTIVFSDAGVLLDGQHRLSACVKTDTPIVCLVVRGIRQNAQMTMDVGKKRTLAEHLKLLGYADYNTIAAIGEALCRSDEYGIESALHSASGYEHTLQHSLRWITGNYEDRVRPVTSLSRAVQKRYKGVSAKTAALILDQLAQKSADPEDVEGFFDELLERKVPSVQVFLLVKQLRANAESRKGHMPQRTIAALVIKTWNAWIQGVDMKTLRFRQGGAKPEAFPQVIVP